jgi:hypothetical protein
MRPTFKEKLAAFVLVMVGTGGFIFLSTHLMVGGLGVCK